MKVVFRCNASPEVGRGHVMRCLASAQAFAWAGWDVAFAGGPETLATAPALARSQFHFMEWSGVWPSANVVVIDSYDLDAADEAEARSSGAIVVAFEDRPTREHVADFILDPTPGRTSKDYAGLCSGRLLLGPEYAQMRPEWLAGRASARVAGVSRKVTSVLVSMGATDPGNASKRALLALRKAGYGGKVIVVLAPSAPHLESVREMLHGNEEFVVDPPDLPRLVTGVDLVIGAGGSSCFERACVGKPSILLPTAENQVDLLAAFSATGAARALDHAQANEIEALSDAFKAALSDSDWRRNASERAAALTDGRGAQRLLVELSGAIENAHGDSARLRLANSDDSDWLLDLQRQPGTRRFSLRPDVPQPMEHQAWFARVLSDPSILLAMVTCRGDRVGMLRLDGRAPFGGAACQQPAALTVSIAIDEAHQRAGFGAAALALARRLAPSAELHAYVMPANIASQQLFARAGYTQVSETNWKSTPYE